MKRMRTVTGRDTALYYGGGPNRIDQAVVNGPMALCNRLLLGLLLVALLLLPAAGSAWELRLTDNEGTQRFPSISGQKIVWEDDRNGDWDIYLYDMGTGQTRRLTDDPKDQMAPRISGNRVVWQDYRNSVSQYENPDIYYLDLETGFERMLNSPDSTYGGYEERPDIDGDMVVWEDSAAAISEFSRIYFYDLENPAPIQIYQYSNAQTRPAVSDRKVVWTDFNLDGVYFRYLLDSQVHLLEQTNESPVTGIGISGNRVVYTKFMPDDLRYNIRLFELDLTMTGGTGRWLSPGAAQQEQPAIDGDRVVWRDERNGNEDIYLYDLSVEQEVPLVVAPGSQNSPDIDGDLVAFTDNRNGNDDIYLASVPVLTPTPTPTVPVLAVPGAADVPHDLNKDGKYEDVNGNSRKDFADVVLFFNQMTWIAANEPVAAFDFNGNGRIDFADVVQLFNGL